MSIKIGITGGIGSGKSVVSRLFGIMGIPVYISDIEAKRITQTDPVICQELCALVGQDVFQNGVLNRSLLASYMFGHPNRVQKVNEIIHPQVKEDFRRWASTSMADSIPTNCSPPNRAAHRRKSSFTCG